MDRLEALGAFVAVAEARGFAAAARRLGVSPPTVTRLVAALEEHLGVRLLVRTTRTVRLTDAGARFLADGKRILSELDEAEGNAARSRTELAGRISVTAPVMFGGLHVAPVLCDFLGEHPGVTLRALFVDRVVDLVEEGIDVAVRIAELPDSSVRAVRVGAVGRVVCASPAYLRRKGAPERPADLEHHDAIGFFGSSATAGFTFPGQRKVATPRLRLELNSSEVAVAAAVAGHGLLRALSYQVEAEIRAGRLRRVLTAYEPKEVPVHVVYTEGRHASARVRAFVDHAVERLRERLRGRG